VPRRARASCSSNPRHPWAHQASSQMPVTAGCSARTSWRPRAPTASRPQRWRSGRPHCRRPRRYDLSVSHPVEGLKLGTLGIAKDVAKLSCCGLLVDSAIMRVVTPTMAEQYLRERGHSQPADPAAARPAGWPRPSRFSPPMTRASSPAKSSIAAAASQRGDDDLPLSKCTCRERA
jgi:hypothetical protein